MAYAPPASRGWGLAVFVAALLGAALCAALWAAPGPASADARAPQAETGFRLVMVEQAGCHYCIAWHAEVGPAWPNTAAGAFAPLRTEQLRRISDDLALERRVMFTPTFVVVDAAGAELGRLEGYPGADFFWPVIERLLADTAGFDPAAAAAPPETD